MAMGGCLASGDFRTGTLPGLGFLKQRRLSLVMGAAPISSSA